MDPMVLQTEEQILDQQKGNESDLGSDFESDFESDENPQIEKKKKKKKISIPVYQQNKEDMETAEKYFKELGFLQLFKRLREEKTTKEKREEIFESFLTTLNDREGRKPLHDLMWKRRGNNNELGNNNKGQTDMRNQIDSLIEKSWCLTWNDLKVTRIFRYIFKKLLSREEEEVCLLIDKIVNNLLPNIVDIKNFKKDFLKFFVEKNDDETPKIDQKPRNEDINNKICSAILKALDTTKKLITCLKFDKLHVAYNSFADEEISKIAKEIEASVLDVTNAEQKINDYRQLMPRSTSVPGDLDENSHNKYNSQWFEEFVGGLIPQLLMVLGYPIIHSKIDTIQRERTAGIKEDNLNKALNSLRVWVLGIRNPRVDAVARFVDGNGMVTIIAFQMTTESPMSHANTLLFFAKVVGEYDGHCLLFLTEKEKQEIERVLWVLLWVHAQNVNESTCTLVPVKIQKTVGGKKHYEYLGKELHDIKQRVVKVKEHDAFTGFNSKDGPLEDIYSFSDDTPLRAYVTEFRTSLASSDNSPSSAAPEVPSPSTPQDVHATTSSNAASSQVVQSLSPVNLFSNMATSQNAHAITPSKAASSVVLSSSPVDHYLKDQAGGLARKMIEQEEDVRCVGELIQNEIMVHNLSLPQVFTQSQSQLSDDDYDSDPSPNKRSKPNNDDDA